MDIDDRWCDSKVGFGVLLFSLKILHILKKCSFVQGPLAMVFTADELKHLIRALFQNTERRAAVMAKIR